VTAAPFHLAGERLLLDPGGGLFWPGQKLLAVADLHLEKGSAAALKGHLLPPWDTAATLDRVALMLRRYKPAVLVALGDSFHDRAGAGRLMAADRARLGQIAASTRLIWVLGNHDPVAPDGLAGEVVDEIRLGNLVFRHEGQAGARGEISGHFHPKAAIPTSGTVVSRPCFMTDGYRVMLPAIGAYTGGLDVRDPAIAQLFPRGGRAFLLGRDRLYSFSMAARRGGVASAPNFPPRAAAVGE
jgi:DNA ligase-associated metallophosphoesterase